MKKILLITAFLPLFCKAQTANNSQDACGDSFYEPVSNNEMRIIYLNAKFKNDGYSLVRLAKIENEKQFLTDIKAGDILYDAYKIGIANEDPALLYNVATYENSANLVALKAGDILYEAYKAAMYRKNAYILFKIAYYENNEKIMDIKAGDILYEAYKTALANKDVSILYKIADYEQQKNIMKFTSEEIRREVANIKY